jgi:hypothetical protein
MNKQNVLITVDEKHVDRIEEVADELRRAGLNVKEILGSIGVITGRAEPSIRAELAGITGVTNIEDELTVQLPPPESDIQ